MNRERLSPGERDRLLFEIHATLPEIGRRLDNHYDMLKEMNGRVRAAEKAIARILGIGGAVGLIFSAGLGWLGWKK